MKHIKLFETYTNQLNEDVLRLRTLTEKSKMGFGKYYDYTVGDLLKIDKNEYLQWVYYNSDMINFMPEILDKIGITDEFRISKPGKNPYKFDNFKKFIYKNMTDEERFNNLKKLTHMKKQDKLANLNDYISKKNQFTKGVMQSRNQGKL